MFNSLSDRLTATFKGLRGKGRLSEADISICAACHGQAIWIVDRHDDPPSATRVHPA